MKTEKKISPLQGIDRKDHEARYLWSEIVIRCLGAGADCGDLRDPTKQAILAAADEAVLALRQRFDPRNMRVHTRRVGFRTQVVESRKKRDKSDRRMKPVLPSVAQ